MFASAAEFRVLGEAADGVEGVDMAVRLDPDVVLMDLRMPGGGGVAAITELTRRGARSKVLVLTTYDTDSDTLPAIEAGATGYLLKDAPRDELFTAVRAAADGRTVLSCGGRLPADLTRAHPGRARPRGAVRARARGAPARRPGDVEP